mgnify:CR=1 FL=1
MLGGLVEAGAGVAMVVAPEPATTGAGVGLMTDGVRRIAEGLD